MKRFFTKRMKKILLIASGNTCQKCGKKLDGTFHADHIHPFSKKGSTTLNNAQALCEECNLKKGDKIE